MTTQTIIRYNKITRQWQAVNGQVHTFPAGKEGKRAALLCALNSDQPHLAAIVGDIAEMHNHNPALVDRLLKASQLITKGHVYNGGKVKSQSSEEVYQTSFEGFPKSWYCTCEDFDNGLQRQAGLIKWGGIDTDYGLMCKHTLAQLIAHLAGLMLEDEEIPF
jgi:hypothetical protein